MNIKKDLWINIKCSGYVTFPFYVENTCFSGFVFMLCEGEPYVYTTGGTIRTCLSLFVKAQTRFSYAALS